MELYEELWTGKLHETYARLMQGLFCPITENSTYYKFLLHLVRGFMKDGNDRGPRKNRVVGVGWGCEPVTVM